MLIWPLQENIEAEFITFYIISCLFFLNLICVCLFSFKFNFSVCVFYFFFCFVIFKYLLWNAAYLFDYFRSYCVCTQIVSLRLVLGHSCIHHLWLWCVTIWHTGHRCRSRLYAPCHVWLNRNTIARSSWKRKYMFLFKYFISIEHDLSNSIVCKLIWKR